MSQDVITDYIASCPIDRQEKLNEIRNIIRQTLPNAKEQIKYGMPTFYQKENLVHFANAKNHFGFYPSPKAIEHFSEALSPYKTSKGAIQFPASKEIPIELIRAICLWRLEQVEK